MIHHLPKEIIYEIINYIELWNIASLYLTCIPLKKIIHRKIKIVLGLQCSENDKNINLHKQIQLFRFIISLGPNFGKNVNFSFNNEIHYR